MRRSAAVALLVLCALPLIALREAYRSGADVLRRLNIQEDVARDCIWSSFSGMYLSMPDPRALKAVAKGDRAAIVKEIASYARDYTQSDAFAKRYEEYRISRKPAPPEAPKSMDQQKKEQKENLAKSIKEAEDGMKSMSAENRATVQGVVDALKKQLASIDDPANPMFSKEMAEMTQQGYEMQKQQYQKQVEEWGKEFPATSREMLRAWLTKFLEVSADIDFNAQLKDGLGTTKMFVNPDYEAKSDQWKMCYRAGKETVQAGRAYAKSWLADLEKGQ